MVPHPGPSIYKPSHRSSHPVGVRMGHNIHSSQLSKVTDWQDYHRGEEGQWKEEGRRKILFFVWVY